MTHADVLLGLQWGDEGKGKVVDYLATHYDMVARFQGGPNAGHTLILEGGQKYVLHTIPSGIFFADTKNLIGNGVVVDPLTLEQEIQKLEQAGLNLNHNLFLSRKAHLILPTHKILDAASEEAKGSAKIGSTLKGIGPTYMDKTGRNGLRVGDLELPDFKERYEALKQKHLKLLELYGHDFQLASLERAWFESLERVKQLNLVDGEYFVGEALAAGQKVLAEGAQGAMLDIDFGTYPFVTSSNTTSAGVCTGLGVAPRRIGEVIGISKAYCTRVGSGPFPTELDDETGERLRKEGGEFGATTGRPRRCGWIDLPALRYAIQLSGVTQLAITKVDVLNAFEEIKVCTAYRINGQESERLPYDMTGVDIEPVYRSFPGWNSNVDDIDRYEDLPETLRHYIDFLEDALDTPVTMVSLGPERDRLLRRSSSRHSSASAGSPAGEGVGA
jgi:adenylosuccinate synthase